MTLASTYSFKHFDFLQLHAISSAKFSTFSIKACGVNIPENIKSRFRGWTRNYSANTSCSAPVIHGTRPSCPPKLLRTSCPSHRRNLFSGRAAPPPCWTEQVSFPLTATVIRIDQPQINTRNSAKRFADLNCCDEVGVSRASRARACVYVRVCVGVGRTGSDRSVFENMDVDELFKNGGAGSAGCPHSSTEFRASLFRLFFCRTLQFTKLLYSYCLVCSRYIMYITVYLALLQSFGRWLINCCGYCRTYM